MPVGRVASKGSGRVPAHAIHVEREAGRRPAPRRALADNAPRIRILAIDPEKVGMLIGPGGRVIRGIEAESGADEVSVSLLSSLVHSFYQYIPPHPLLSGVCRCTLCRQESFQRRRGLGEPHDLQYTVVLAIRDPHLNVLLESTLAALICFALGSSPARGLPSQGMLLHLVSSGGVGVA